MMVIVLTGLIMALNASFIGSVCSHYGLHWSVLAVGLTFNALVCTIAKQLSEIRR